MAPLARQWRRARPLSEVRGPAPPAPPPRPAGGGSGVVLTATRAFPAWSVRKSWFPEQGRGRPRRSRTPSPRGSTPAGRSPAPLGGSGPGARLARAGSAVRRRRAARGGRAGGRRLRCAPPTRAVRGGARAPPRGRDRTPRSHRAVSANPALAPRSPAGPPWSALYSFSPVSAAGPRGAPCARCPALLPRPAARASGRVPAGRTARSDPARRRGTCGHRARLGHSAPPAPGGACRGLGRILPRH